MQAATCLHAINKVMTGVAKAVVAHYLNNFSPLLHELRNIYRKGTLCKFDLYVKIYSR
jgi:hypothetical protein